MNSFESIVASLLELEGFWVRIGYKVALPKDDKVKIGKRYSPRWELDVVAYKPADNLLRVVECKSFLDSRGVSRKGLDPETGGTPRFKLFNDEKLRGVVLEQLKKQLRASGSIPPNPDIQLCLAAGKIAAKHKDWIDKHFKDKNWKLLDREWIVAGLKNLAKSGYEDSAASIVAKLLAQDGKPKRKR